MNRILEIKSKVLGILVVIPLLAFTWEGLLLCLASPGISREEEREKGEQAKVSFGSCDRLVIIRQSRRRVNA